MVSPMVSRMFVSTLLLVLGLQLSALAGFSEDVRMASTKLLNALDASEEKEILLPHDHRLRWEMRYTGGGRRGVQISDLSKENQKLAEDLMSLVLSSYGLQMCDAVGKQDTPDGYKHHFITFFGDPRTTKDFVWRVTEHHFTIVDVHFEDGQLKEFGPILLGANPPTLWLEEEAIFIKAWKALGNQKDNFLTRGHAIASEPVDKRLKLEFKTFPEASKKHILAAWEERMRIFTPPLRKQVESLFEKHGGFDQMKASFYNGPAERACKEGGRWDFKLGNENCVFDFETSRGHIHSSIWVRD